MRIAFGERIQRVDDDVFGAGEWPEIAAQQITQRESAETSAAPAEKFTARNGWADMHINSGKQIHWSSAGRGKNPRAWRPQLCRPPLEIRPARRQARLQ